VVAAKKNQKILSIPRNAILSQNFYN